VPEPVLPLLRLTLAETEVLLVAVEIALKLDSAVLSDPEAQRMAEEQILERAGPGEVARVDQALASARDRVPTLHALHSMLAEHREALERVRKAD
jgi:hypothetical protein